MMAIGIGEPVIPFDAYSVALSAPARAGVYAICNAQGTYVYFGESSDIQRRLTEHLEDILHCMHRHGAASFAYELVPTAFGRVARQNALIALYPTACNQMFG